MQQFQDEKWPTKRWPNFYPGEFRCSTSGETWVNLPFIDLLQHLRVSVGFALPISSGYRSIFHPIEKAKTDAGKQPGAHITGCAADLLVSGDKAWAVVNKATSLGFTGIGISQAGPHNTRFIHLDTLPNGDGQPRPTVWSY